MTIGILLELLEVDVHHVVHFLIVLFLLFRLGLRFCSICVVAYNHSKHSIGDIVWLELVIAGISG
jgi:hypothetical protein